MLRLVIKKQIRLSYFYHGMHCLYKADFASGRVGQMPGPFLLALVGKQTIKRLKTKI